MSTLQLLTVSMGSLCDWQISSKVAAVLTCLQHEQLRSMGPLYDAENLTSLYVAESVTSGAIQMKAGLSLLKTDPEHVTDEDHTQMQNTAGIMGYKHALEKYAA